MTPASRVIFVLNSHTLFINFRFWASLMAPFQRLLILMGVLGPLAGLIAAIILLWHRGVGALDVSILASMYALTMAASPSGSIVS